MDGTGAPLFPGIGRFISVALRSTGRKPDGTTWTNPGRAKLGFSPSMHMGAPVTKKKQPVAETQAA